MNKFKAGDVVPDFSIQVLANKSYSLKDFAGKYLVMYFYPKDNTPGCTIEARDFNSLKSEFEKLNAEIIGISKDTHASHDKFKNNFNLNIHLGSDHDSNTCEKFNVWAQKSMFGKKYMGIERSTFLIGPDGKFAHVWYNVSAMGHAKEVLKKLKDISAL